MNTWKVILATFVIFGAGVVTGGLVVRYSQHAPWNKSLPAAQPARDQSSKAEIAPRGTNRPVNLPGSLMRGMRKDMLKSLDCELNLTEAQRERIEKNLGDGQERTRKICDKIAPELRDEWNRVKCEIRAELTEEQQQKFDAFMKHSRKSEERRAPQLREDLPVKDSLLLESPAQP